MRGSFRNTQKYDVDDAPPWFEEITVALSVDSPAAPESVARLTAHAERACHAAQSLRRGVPVTLATRLNGAALPSG